MSRKPQKQTNVQAEDEVFSLEGRPNTQPDAPDNA